MTPITVYKRDHLGNRVWHYAGDVIARGETWVCLEAPFNRADVDAGYVVFRQGDLFREWFYSDRWYNVFRLQDVREGTLTGWYCNITRPALIGADSVEADDLALDVFVHADGTVLVLDEDEFDALPLPQADRAAALAAVDGLRALVSSRQPPFDEITR